MAVAVKNMPEKPGQSPFERLEVASLLGAVYVLAALGVVAFGVPALWSGSVSSFLTGMLGEFFDVALLLLAMFVVAGALIYTGVRLVGPHPVHGLRAGVFLGVVGILGITLITFGLGYVLEGWAQSETGLALGLGLTAAIGIALVVAAFRAMTRPGFAKLLMQLEDQGWFSMTSYKRSQGLRVRRCTILGILVLAGCGIYTLLAHKTLEAGTYKDWLLPIPFTKGTIDSAGDAAALPDAKIAQQERITRHEFREINDQLRSSLKIKDPGDTNFKVGQIVSKADFDEERLKEKTNEGMRPATSVQPVLVAATFPSVKLLPDVRFTVPILLTLAALWFAYRVVNFPTFADFLIATEAEMNKVSWTTQKRLVQDTIVVLTTVIFMTVFLLVADLVWGKILSSVGVLQFGDPAAAEAGEKGSMDW